MKNVVLSIGVILASVAAAAQTHLPTNRAEAAKMERVELEKATEMRVLEMLEADRMRSEQKRQAVIEETSFNIRPATTTTTTY